MTVLFRSRTWLSLLIIVLLFAAAAGRAGAEPAELSPADRLLPLVGDALVQAGDKHWPEVSKDLEKLEAAWKEAASAAPGSSSAVPAALSKAKDALKTADTHPEEAYAAISGLALAVNEYAETGREGTAAPSGGEDAAALLPYLDRLQKHIEQEQWEDAKAVYRSIDSRWLAVEHSIRANNLQAYGAIETQLSLIRIAIQASPPLKDKAVSEIGELRKAISGAVNDRGPNASPGAAAETSPAGLIRILEQAENAVQAGRAEEAAGKMQDFIRLWPLVEGQVQTRSAAAYTSIENRMTEVPGYLLSMPPQLEKAQAAIQSLKAELEPFAGAAHYTAWDAGLVLLREGVEALLVIAALLAFLHRTGNGSRRKWIWSGAGTGLLASAVIAVLLSYTVSKAASGSAREFIEGITGLVAVVFMFVVGAWLHGKSKARAWSQYIRRQAETALRRGSLWSLFAVAFLAVLREGAETALFYVGMAPSMNPLQMAIGIGAALAALALLGYAMIRFGGRLPIRPFFLCATVLIYYLAVKFLGESIHSLQVSGRLPVHTSGHLPSIGWLGVYPAWESLLPQLAVLAAIVVTVVWTERRKQAAARPDETARPPAVPQE